ncbi:two-component system response regulator [Telluribacter sp. SYSU D00476]|uniref:response regulator n=1 Tax=Telluribacter sp. SYSU D00476 TaxID=2811430 RepID=UPI001FF3171A|nr:response regulator [Telluribacter sp. SYSU D00476]
MIKNVLIIDDDETSIFVTKRRILKSDFAANVLTPGYGVSAIPYFEELIASGDQEVPELVFLDLNMPFLNGWKFLDVFVQHFLPLLPTIHICVLSSLNPSEEVKATIPPCVIAFINKPLAAQDLENLKKHECLSPYFSEVV